MRGQRRLFAPQVVQTSAMDCGPAALTCLLDGFGVHASYGRLREACQTEVDGTSIDALEDIACALGLDAEQVMMPVDHLHLDEAHALPALVVTRHPTGLTHFVVVWRRHGRYLQVMDPAVGRRWVRAERFLRDVYVHEFPIPADAFEEWARSEDFLRPLASRLGALGADPDTARRLTDRAQAEGGWQGVAALDAAVRMAAATATTQGGERAALAERMSTGEERERLPNRHWFAGPGTNGDGDVVVKGAVLVRVNGLAEEPVALERLPPDLRAALEEPRPRPGRLLVGLLRTVGGMRPAAVAVAAVVAAAGTTGEALLVRNLVRAADTGASRSVAVLLALAVGLLLLEGWLASTALGLGRGLESHLGGSLLRRLPRLPDPYFRSRPVSDLGERAHRLHFLRQLPIVGTELIRALAEVVALTVAIALVNPASAVPAVLAAIVAVGAALAMQPTLVERDLCLRNHSGATARFYLDGLLGLVALQAHSAEAVVETEHGRLLDDWRSAARSVARTVVTAEALQGAIGVALAAWLVVGARSRAAEPATFLLLAYWALSLPLLGQRIGVLARQYPSYRNTTLRFLEPLSSPEDPSATASPSGTAPSVSGADIRMEGVAVVAAGQTILADVDLHIPAGSRVAVVGSSGAGKSSLVGLLLGWHRPASGHLLIDGVAVDASGLGHLRRHTAWVDPSVAIWNRSLADNLTYGAAGTSVDLAAAIADVDLAPVVARLPDGTEEVLGEGGGLLSGGEAQRVRLGRARLRSDVRLAVLDEPFRGLDRAQRRSLLERSQGWWPGATFILVTHDVGDTLGFERVLVIDAGRVLEDGDPQALAAREGSRYRALLDAEAEAKAAFEGPTWRSVQLESGRLTVAELRP